MSFLVRLFELWFAPPWWVRSIILFLVFSFGHWYIFYQPHGIESTTMAGIWRGITAATIWAAVEYVLVGFGILGDPEDGDT